SGVGRVYVVWRVAIAGCLARAQLDCEWGGVADQAGQWDGCVVWAAVVDAAGSRGDADEPPGVEGAEQGA
ncbi:hypothetical protein B1218_37140, partial [Pseudomonas ogarae]